MFLRAYKFNVHESISDNISNTRWHRGRSRMPTHSPGRGIFVWHAMKEWLASLVLCEKRFTIISASTNMPRPGEWVGILERPRRLPLHGIISEMSSWTMVVRPSNQYLNPNLGWGGLPTKICQQIFVGSVFFPPKTKKIADIQQIFAPATTLE